MNNRESMQKAFEAWMKKEMPHEPLEIIADSGVYLGGYVQTLWVGYQAALASQVQQPTQVQTFDSEQLVRRLQSFLDRLCNDNYSATMFEGDACSLREAIEKLRHNYKKAKLQSQAQQPASGGR